MIATYIVLGIGALALLLALLLTVLGLYHIFR